MKNNLLIKLWISESTSLFKKKLSYSKSDVYIYIYIYIYILFLRRIVTRTVLVIVLLFIGCKKQNNKCRIINILILKSRITNFKCERVFCRKCNSQFLLWGKIAKKSILSVATMTSFSWVEFQKVRNIQS